MSLENITARMKTINAAVTGITTALEDPPEKLDTAELPLVFTMVGDGDLDYQAMGLARFDHRLRIQVWGDPIGQNENAAARIDALKPFVSRFVVAYAAAIKLNSLADLDRGEAYLTAYRFAVREYGGTPHAMLEFDMTVTEKSAVTVDL